MKSAATFAIVTAAVLLSSCAGKTGIQNVSLQAEPLSHVPSGDLLQIYSKALERTAQQTYPDSYLHAFSFQVTDDNIPIAFDAVFAFRSDDTKRLLLTIDGNSNLTPFSESGEFIPKPTLRESQFSTPVGPLQVTLGENHQYHLRPAEWHVSAAQLIDMARRYRLRGALVGLAPAGVYKKDQKAVWSVPSTKTLDKAVLALDLADDYPLFLMSGTEKSSSRDEVTTLYLVIDGVSGLVLASDKTTMHMTQF